MKNYKILIFVSAWIVISAVLSAAIGIHKYSFNGKFSAGTFLANIDISGKTLEEGRAILSNTVDEFFKKPFKIKILSKTEEFLPEELGIKITIDDSLKIIKSYDAKGKFFPIVTINYDLLLAQLENKFELKKIAAKPASFYFNEKGDLAIKEGEIGTGVDETKLIKDLKNSARTLKSDLVIAETYSMKPQISKTMLLEQEDAIKAALNQKIILIDPVYSDDWQITLKDHLDWVKFEAKEEVLLPFLGEKILLDVRFDNRNKKHINIAIDQQKLNEFIDAKISKWLDRPAENVNIFTDEHGKIIIEGKGSDGKKVQREFLKKSIELALLNKISDVQIPVVSITPLINISEDLQQKGIKERISIGHTSYYGSPQNRVHNIKTGSAKFNGLIIAPGETFNFNQNLGPVDASTGFKKELVIKSEGTLPEFGGGICQVSTTMFRAALLGGLPIKERNQHSYAVSYYSQILGHGLDATIYLGGPNFKFINDTGKHILIQAYVEKDFELYIVFYGTLDGRRVEMEGPYLSSYRSPGPTQYVETTDLPPGEKKQLEKAHTGFNALWYRHLFNKDGIESKEPIATHYKAVPSKIAVGTAPKPEKE